MTERRTSDRRQCDHGGRTCPRIIQAIPLPSVERPRDLSRRIATLIVAGFFLLIAVANGLVPAFVRLFTGAA